MVELFLTVAEDVEKYLWPAAWAVDPYSVPGFYNPPWILPFLYLLRFLTLPQASFLIRALVIVSAVNVSWRWSRHPVAVVAYLLSAPVLYDLMSGNINVLILNGLFVFDSLALLILSLKPQLTVGAMARIIWRRPRSAIWLVVVCIASLVLYGWWPAAIDVDLLANVNWNFSVWPAGIVVGLLILLLSRDRLAATAASPFFSPYLSGAGWSGFALWLCVRYPWAMLLIDLFLPSHYVRAFVDVI